MPWSLLKITTAVHAKGAKSNAKNRKDFCSSLRFFALYFALRTLREPAYRNSPVIANVIAWLTFTPKKPYPHQLTSTQQLVSFP